MIENFINSSIRLFFINVIWLWRTIHDYCAITLLIFFYTSVYYNII